MGVCSPSGKPQYNHVPSAAMRMSISPQSGGFQDIVTAVAGFVTAITALLREIRAWRDQRPTPNRPRRAYRLGRTALNLGLQAAAARPSDGRRGTRGRADRERRKIGSSALFRSVVASQRPV